MSKQYRSGTDSRTATRAGMAAISCAAVFLAAFLLDLAGVWSGMDRIAYDALLSVRLKASPLEMSPRILPVDLNDRAERNLGSRVDTREAFVDLFTVLGAGGLSGGMDFLFAGNRDPAVDAAMAAAAGNMESLTLAVVPLDRAASKFSGNPLDAEDDALLRRHLWFPVVKSAGRIPEADSFLVPNRQLAERSGHIGHIGVSPDSDGVYRKVPLLYRYSGGFMPSLPLALAQAHFGFDASKVVVDAGRWIILPLAADKTVRIPVDATGAAWIPYPSTWMSGWKRVPMDTIANAAADEDSMYETVDSLSGSILVVADTTTAKKDFGTTPLETLYPLSGIHTSVLNGVLTRVFFRDQPTSLRLLMAALLFACAWLALTRKDDLGFHAVFAGAFVFILASGLAFWFLLDMVPWVAALSVATLTVWAGGFARRLERSREERLLLEGALTRYFPRALAARVISEGKVDLKPANKDLTILFADIAGFTKWSSDKPPETVHAFLCDYLESMAAIIHENGGTVDKFIGDGILAFFGDPFEQIDHASRCLRAALAMQERVRELRDKWLSAAGIDLKIRIGINSGNVIVGNLGTKTRIEYTVIGATVNLASRMESNAPVGGILVTSDARAAASPDFLFGGAVEISAKGYDTSIQAFELRGKN